MAYKDPADRRACMKRYRERHPERRKASWQNWIAKHPGYDKERHRATTLAYLDTEHWKWEDVEGYDGFTTNTEVHHRREGIGYTRAQLKEQGQYYNCRADELICVTKAEHKRIHEQIDKFFKRNNYKEK